jgi:subtilase family serine protease
MLAIPDAAPCLFGQSAAFDSGAMQTLPQHHPYWASPANLVAPVADEELLDQMTLVLARTPAQQAAFEQFLADQQDPASPVFHHWLTPDEIGERFGPSLQQLEAAKHWLESQGIQITGIARSRSFINFRGTSAAVGAAFHASFGRYRVNGREHVSIDRAPQIPAEIAPSVKAIRGLYSIDEVPLHRAEVVTSPTPDITFNGGHFLGPDDVATIYDIPTGITGSGVKIGLVAESRTDFADFTNFRARTGSTLPNPTEIIPTAFGGIDPGPAASAPPGSGVQGEATLDVLRSGTIAPGAKVLLVAATPKSGGIGVDAQYLVETTPVPVKVISISFGFCESGAGPSGVSFWDSLFQTAAGEGISVFVSSGDSGASGCDSSFEAPPASPAPNSPNYICSSSYATCVGGTEFADTADPSKYWSTSNGAGFLSALSYIPEGAWNEPFNNNGATQPASSGGGVSLDIPTPSWQTGTGVPAARKGRYTPDISFSASAHDGYFGCLASAGGSCVPNSQGGFGFVSFSGTSAAAPDMAGITALLDAKLGTASGNLNPMLYKLASSAPTAFHDVTVATSGVSGCTVSRASMCNNSVPGPDGLSGGQAGFLVTTGYDEVTGLGSLDVNKFLNDQTPLPALSSVSFTPATAASGSITDFAIDLSQVAPSGGINVSLTSSNSSVFKPPTSSVSISDGTKGLVLALQVPTVKTKTSVTFTATYNGVSKSATITINPGAIPTVVTGSATKISGTSATLSGTVNPNGFDTHAHFQYSASGSTGTTASVDVGSGKTAVTTSVVLTGLKTNTTYTYTLVATGASSSVAGALLSFKTLGPAPGLATGSASAVTATTATLAASLDPRAADTHYTFSYGTSSTLAGALKTASLDGGSGNSVITVTAPLTGLKANTKYYYRAQATNSGGTTTGSIKSFTTN